MWNIIIFGLLFCCIQCTSAEFKYWKSKDIETCKGKFRLICPSDDEDLVLKNATYKPGVCSCSRCQNGVLAKFPALDDLLLQCPGNASSCNATLNPYRKVPCKCLQKILHVEYRCIKRNLYQRVCGERSKEFRSRKYGHIINPLFPSKTEAQNCALVFVVGEKKIVRIAAWQLQVPKEWEARFCNYTYCHDLLVYEKDTYYELIGDSFIRLSGKNHTNEQIEMVSKFHFEYEVKQIVITTSTRQWPDIYKYSRKEIGVLKVHSKINTAAAVGGSLGAVVIIGMIIAALYICKKRYEDLQEEETKMMKEIQSNMYFSDEFQKRKSLTEGVENKASQDGTDA